jgi:hypothetical protein
LGVVEWDGAASGDLHLLVTFSGNKHDVIRAGFSNGKMNRRAAVRFDFVPRAGTL